MSNCNHKMQKHVHEVLGSVRLAELCQDPHNHRFAGITEEAVIVQGGHIHKLIAKTDFYEDHFHTICVTTGLQEEVGDGCDKRHVHFIDSSTECEDGHLHEFIAATLIDNPIGD